VAKWEGRGGRAWALSPLTLTAMERASGAVRRARALDALLRMDCIVKGEARESPAPPSPWKRESLMRRKNADLVAKSGRLNGGLCGLINLQLWGAT